jgi:sugar transferase (PEP-CTERM system associated)
MTTYLNRQRSILILGDIILMLAVTVVMPWIRFGSSIDNFRIHPGAIALTTMTYLTMLYILDMFNFERINKPGEIAMRSAAAVIIAGSFVAFLFYFLPNWKYGRGLLLIQMSLTWFLVFIWTWFFSASYPITIENKNTLIIGAGKSGSDLIHLIDSLMTPYKVVGFLDDDINKHEKKIGSATVIGRTSDLADVAKRMCAKIAILAITNDRSTVLIQNILKARVEGVTIVEMPNVYESLTARIPVNHIHDGWLLFSQGFYLISKDTLQKLKRLIDISASFLLLIILLPVAILTAILIRIDSRGPIFFQQRRVGKDGNIFYLWKFRSMRKNAENNCAVWAVENDSRVTRVGKWIRLFRIDEIPQIYNVVKGEMSLVGPRPERPEFVEQLEKKIPYYPLRHIVRPGLTGWAQLNYPYGASEEDAMVKLEYDLYYIKNMSIYLEMKIILKTIGVVLFRQGSR